MPKGWWERKNRDPSRLLGRLDPHVAQTFLNGPGDAQAGVGAQPLQQLGGLRPALELERLLGALGHPVGGAAAEIPGVDVGVVRHEILDDLVQSAEGGAMQGGEVRLVDGVDVGAGLDEKTHRRFCTG